jgi:hypothetical protein
MVALMVSGSVAQAVLFQDTFNVADTADENADVASRQSGGDVVSDYTCTASVYYGISGGKLAQTGGGSLTLNANLAGALVGNDFEISYKLAINTSDGKWTSLYLMSANENSRGSSRVGLHAWDNSVGTAYTVYHGTGDAQQSTSVTYAAMVSLMGGTFDRSAEHTIQLVSTAGTGTYDFLVDGVLVLDDLAYAFSEDTTRQLGIVSTMVNKGAGSTYDDLTVIPEPASLGLFVFTGSAILLIRRRFIS